MYVCVPVRKDIRWHKLYERCYACGFTYECTNNGMKYYIPEWNVQNIQNIAQQHNIAEKFK